MDYSTTVEELKDHFKICCGERGIEAIKKVTIICDKNTGHPIGQAFIAFETAEIAENSKKLDDSLFKG